MNISTQAQPRAQPQEQQERPPPLSLPWSLRLLFVVGGASSALPSLALLSIVNDRAGIPPQYLPAYGAIAVLPYSLKPLYAFVGNKLVRGLGQSRLLLAVLLVLNGLAYIGTDLFVHNNGIIPCFVWGFLRGLTSAWPDFLLGLMLIESAKESTGSSASYKYQDCASIFSSQAATMRNSGSLLASMVTFSLFLARHFQLVEAQLSPAVVSILLIGTAVLNVGGGVFAMLYDHHSATSIHAVRINCNEFSQDEQGRTKRDDNSNRQGTYQVVETEESSRLLDAKDVLETLSLQPAASSRMNLAEICDIASLVFFQALLMLSALRHPILSVTTTVAWTASITLIGLGLVTTLVISSCSPKQDDSGERPYVGESTKTIPPKRLALFFVLRHSIPSAGMLVYSYIYTIFSAEPLFLQILSIVESAVSTLATWTYERCFAKTYHSGWKMIGLIAVLSAVAGAVSLLDVVVVHATTVGVAVTPQVRWLLLAVMICTYFMGSVGYMPMVVLATANVVSSDNADKQIEHLNERNDSVEGAGIELTLKANEGVAFEHETEQRPVYDEGMQYASYLSCIYVGAQVGDWIAVPIIAALGISRENEWKNLDLFIVICALGRIASIAFLWLIRPTATLQTPSSLP